MADVFAQLEASHLRDERESHLLRQFVEQVAAGRFTKSRAVIRAKSLLREVNAVLSPHQEKAPPSPEPSDKGEKA